MVPRLLKTGIRRVFQAAGWDIRRLSHLNEGSGPRVTVLHSLQQARNVGFLPTTVLDIGAAFGSFAQECRTIFPEARYLLLEPLREYLPVLERLKRTMPGMDVLCAAASSVSGEIDIHVHPDLVGSSLYREVEQGTDVNGVPRRVRAVTIDSVVREQRVAGPFLLKLDVQGAELDVLNGANATLRDCEFAVLEVSFFKFFDRGIECCDLLTSMRDRGFVPYDIVGLQYRPLDRALSQADIVFVRERGQFRRHHYYATPEQRARQNELMQAELSRLLP